jgi:hypothetical protein
MPDLTHSIQISRLFRRSVNTSEIHHIQTYELEQVSMTLDTFETHTYS